MWTVESLRAANADQLKIIESIIGLGGAREEELLLLSEEIEELGSPYVACVGKLPFGIGVQAYSRFTLPAGRDGCKAVLTLSHFRAMLGADLTVRYVECTPNYGGENRGIGTHVSALIRLWGRHRRYHRNYCSCVSSQGLIDQPLDASRWGTRRAPVGYEGDAMSAHRYESETTGAVLFAFHRAIDLFIKSYNMVAFDCLECPGQDHFSGFFAMLAPGRLTYQKRPLSPILGLIPEQVIPEQVSTDRLSVALRFPYRDFDRYLNQLLAMKSLARSGEFELAVIGCVTAIEWFLNSLLKKRAEKSISIKRMKPGDLSLSPSSDLWNRLRSIADLRNSAVHGPPPSRQALRVKRGEQTVNGVIAAGLELYREAQKQLKLGLLE